MRSYWFDPSQKWAMRALATLPPPLTTKVPWKLCRLAASWMRRSHARISLGAVADVATTIWLHAGAPCAAAAHDKSRTTKARGSTGGRGSARRGIDGGAAQECGGHAEGRCAGELLVRLEIAFEL